MPNDGRLTRFARQMRKEPTRSERELWKWLRDGRLGGLKFRRQQPLGLYIADFCCPIARVVVELDGVSHADRSDYDLRRDAFLRSKGFLVLRFTEDEFFANLEGSLLKIYRSCQHVFADRPSDFDPFEGLVDRPEF